MIKKLSSIVLGTALTVSVSLASGCTLNTDGRDLFLDNTGGNDGIGAFNPGYGGSSNEGGDGEGGYEEPELPSSSHGSILLTLCMAGETLEEESSVEPVKRADLYTAWCCGPCQMGKALLGDESVHIMKIAGIYHDCYELGKKGKDNLLEICVEAGINCFPTWDFTLWNSGAGKYEITRVRGLQSLESLADYTNCIYNSEATSETDPIPDWLKEKYDL